MAEGRFDWRFELRNIHEGMERDLHQPVGQTILWYQYDDATSIVDPIYDVGASPQGRAWKAPIFLPTLSAVKVEGDQNVRDERGLYTVDTMNIVISAAAVRQSGLTDLITLPQSHYDDRVVYEGKVFAVDDIRVRGILTAGYAVVGVMCRQVKDEELINDQTFQQFINLPTQQNAVVQGAYVDEYKDNY